MRNALCVRLATSALVVKFFSSFCRLDLSKHSSTQICIISDFFHDLFGNQNEAFLLLLLLLFLVTSDVRSSGSVVTGNLDAETLLTFVAVCCQ